MTDYIVIKEQGLALVGQAQALTIRDDPGFARAAALRQAIKAYLVRVGELTDPVVKAAHGAHLAALAQQKALTGHAVEADRLVSHALAAYEQAVAAQRQRTEAAARQAQAQAETEARRQAEVQAAEARRAAEEAALTEAAALEAAGDGAGATRVLEQPLVVATPPPPLVFVPPPPVVAVPKADGVTFRDAYRAEVVDFGALIRAVAAGQVPESVLRPHEFALNGMARALRESFALPGVRLVKKRVTVSTAGKA